MQDALDHLEAVQSIATNALNILAAIDADTNLGSWVRSDNNVMYWQLQYIEAVLSVTREENILEILKGRRVAVMALLCLETLDS
jgi:hypothetical protein